MSTLTVRLISEDDRIRWDDFIEKNDGHLLQSYAWGELKGGFGWHPLRLAVEESGSIVACAQFLVRPLPLIFSFAYLPKGPILASDRAQTLPLLLAEIYRQSRRHRAIFLRLEPDGEEGSEWKSWLENAGFQEVEATIQPRSTILVDLDTPPEISGRMKPKTRYNIRLAEKKGVTIREGGESDLHLFYRLLAETGRRDGFFIRSEDYYRQAWRLFSTSGHSRLLLAEFEGQLLAGLMAFAFGRRAWYFYGASSEENREVMPNYLLQWQAMLWAKEKGCTSYDLWGIPDEVGRSGEPPDFDQRRDGLWGVYRFKRGFGGRVVRSAGAFDFVYSRPLYFLLMKLAPRLRPTVSALWEGW